MSTTPPGWYDDGRGARRWWDGERWTESVQSPEDAAAQEPQVTAPRSKLWILWVVLGVVAALLIVLAVVVLPRVFGWFGGSDEDRAIATVELYDDAWSEGDCDAYLATTTTVYQESLGITDCTTFAEQAELFDESTDEYELEISAAEVIGDGVIQVVTVETYLSRYDEQGQERAEPEQIRDELRYELVRQDDRWLIDRLDYNE